MQVRPGEYLPNALMRPNVTDVDRRGRVVERVLINGDAAERQVVDRGFRRSRREDGAVVARVSLDLEGPRALDGEIAAKRDRRGRRIDEEDSGRNINGCAARV